jgi:uncharacterized protein (DUF2147 family)
LAKWNKNVKLIINNNQKILDIMSLKTNKTAILRTLTISMVLMIISQSSWSQIVGKWKTIDDETNQPKSIVEIWKSSDGMYYGKIMKLFDETKKDNVCNKCDPKDPRYKQKIVGLKIIMGMKKTAENEWSGGTILDPNNGKVYKCKLYREGKNLMVRGFIGVSVIGRTQTWLPGE